MQRTLKLHVLAANASVTNNGAFKICCGQTSHCIGSFFFKGDIYDQSSQGTCSIGSICRPLRVKCARSTRRGRTSVCRSLHFRQLHLNQIFFCCCCLIFFFPPPPPRPTLTGFLSPSARPWLFRATCVWSVRRCPCYEVLRARDAYLRI